MSWVTNPGNDPYTYTRAKDCERNQTEARRAHYRAVYARRKAAREEAA